MKEYLILLEEYMQTSSWLLNELCKTLQLPQDDQLFYNMLTMQQELSSIFIANTWMVRMHGQDVTFIADSQTITVNLLDTHSITMSFFHSYLSEKGKDDIHNTMLFFHTLVQQGKAIQLEPTNAYRYTITL